MRSLHRPCPNQKLLGHLKNTRVHHQRYRTRAEAIADITETIGIFYHR
ncbi:MAG: hypothetical protein ACYDB1_11435 [Acidiferrobacteraceae bacterium]